MTSKQLGNIGEANTIAKFVLMKVPVYPAFGDNEKSDMIADFNGKLLRILVKTSEKCTNDKMVFSLVSSTMHCKNGVKHIYTKDEVDYFALYNLLSDILILVPYEIIGGKTQVTIRKEESSAKNLYETINWKDFTFDKVIDTT